MVVVPPQDQIDPRHLARQPAILSHSHMRQCHYHMAVALPLQISHSLFGSCQDFLKGNFGARKR
jgi:hypothetical protein